MQKHIIATSAEKINSFFQFFEKNRILLPIPEETRAEVSTRMEIRTDLALEEKELWEESAEETTELEGVLARETVHKGVKTTWVQILNEHGARELHKPVGTYLTLELTAFQKRERNSFQRSAEILGKRLRELLNLEKGRTVLVVGLGNESITPDAIGPRAVRQLLVTRHLVSGMPAFFGEYRPVAAVSPGVLGTTGLESAEVVGGVADRIRPDAMVVVDALASRNLSRVCTTIQLADTGITPGSGIQNSREAFNRERFGIPVVAVGVPTVADVETLIRDCAGDEVSDEQIRTLSGGQRLMVTPRDIDAKVQQISRLVAYGINLALQEQMSLEDLACFVE